MKPTPDPRQVEAALKRIDGLADGITEGYRWLQPLGYSSSSGKGEATRYGMGHISNPTLSAIEAKALETLRHEVRTAGNLVLDAATRISGAQAALERAAKAIDRGPAQGEDNPGPRTATRAEVADAEKARARRQARGEGYGAA